MNSIERARLRLFNLQEKMKVKRSKKLIITADLKVSCSSDAFLKHTCNNFWYTINYSKTIYYLSLCNNID